MTRLEMIREWFERHRDDYCDCQSSPPKAWAEHMEELLAALGLPPRPRAEQEGAKHGAKK
jgi:hypothetical protein